MCTFSCNGGTFNQDGQYANGCECSALSAGASCGAATTVSVPGSANGRVLPASAQEWYQLTFPSEAGTCGLHYRITLINNGNPVVMKVFQNCSGSAVSCDAGGDVASGYTTWEWTNSGAYCTQGYPTTFFVQVFATGSAGTCMDYSLVAFFQ
jgi:hypothetical protein